MAYYEIAFYSGIKTLYGLCVLLMAFGFLLRNTKKGKLSFVILCLVAAGFHTLFYFFLLLSIIPHTNPRRLIKPMVFLVIVLTILMRISGSAASYLQFFFDAFDNEHINLYTTSIVHFGFYLAIIPHMISLYITYKARKYNDSIGLSNSKTDMLYYTSLFSLMFIPFYAVSLTFMRLISTFSMAVIAGTSSVMDYTRESRSKYLMLSLLVILFFLSQKFLLSSAESNFWKDSVVPFFNVF